MDVGLFTTARSTPPVIPPGTTLVTTSGHSTLAVGPGTYVHDSAFDTGGNYTTFSKLCFRDASGRLFRLVENPINVLQAGAVGDGTTDNLAAIGQVRDYLAKLNVSGGTIFVPAGRFRVSAKLVFKKQIRLLGEGNTQNPGIVAGTSYGFPSLYKGSILYFDAGVGGLDFLTHTDEEAMLTVQADIATNGINSQYYEFQQAYRSVVRDLFVLSASNGSGSFVDDANGIQFRTTIHMQNVWVQGFRGHGVRSEGTMDGAGGEGAMWGATNQSVLIDCKMSDNIGDGFHNDGRDANVILLLSCDSSHNQEWGYNDEGFLGNTYVNCHATNNGRNTATTAGSFRANGAVAAHSFIGCYIEDSGSSTSKTELGDGCVVIGGIMSSAVFHPATSTALVMNAAGAHRGTLSGFNDIGASGSNPPTVRATIGRDPSRSQGTAFSFGSSDDSGGMDGYRLKYGGSAAKTWNFEYANAGTATTPIQLPVGGSNWRTSTLYAPSFPQGIILGANGAGPRVHYGTATPASGNWRQGDLVLNAGAQAGQPSYWQCTAGGAPGTWRAGPTL
jgi:hypothetical protein